MKIPDRLHHEKILTLLGLLLLAASVAWACFNWRSPFPVRHRLARAAWINLEGKALAEVTGSTPTLVWSEPEEQSSGPGWVFDLFTPPKLTFDREGRRFVLEKTPPVRSLTTERASADELELVGVRQAPCRLQLVGYTNQAGGLAGLFAVAGSRRAIVAGAGDRIEQFEVLELRMGSAATAKETGGGLNDTVFATVRDERTNETIRLETRRTIFCGPLLATFRAQTGHFESVCLGEKVTTPRGDACEVGRITLDPPGVELLDLLTNAKRIYSLAKASPLRSASAVAVAETREDEWSELDGLGDSR